jgi:hypothetical protein
MNALDLQQGAQHQYTTALCASEPAAIKLQVHTCQGPKTVAALG